MLNATQNTKEKEMKEFTQQWGTASFSGKSYQVNLVWDDERDLYANRPANRAVLVHSEVAVAIEAGQWTQFEDQEVYVDRSFWTRKIQHAVAEKTEETSDLAQAIADWCETGRHEPNEYQERSMAIANVMAAKYGRREAARKLFAVEWFEERERTEQSLADTTCRCDECEDNRSAWRDFLAESFDDEFAARWEHALGSRWTFDDDASWIAEKWVAAARFAGCCDPGCLPMLEALAAA